ncbi:unnamed protein product, partial [Brassica oleracea var. botrytis]
HLEALFSIASRARPNPSLPFLHEVIVSVLKQTLTFVVRVQPCLKFSEASSSLTLSSQTRKLLKPSLRLTLSMAKDVSSDPFLFALRSVCKEISNMDMFEAEFGGIVVTGAEGWSAQHGEASLNSRVDEDVGDDEVDSQPAAETQPQAPCQTQPSTQTHSGNSRAKRRRKEKDMVVEACVKRTEALEVKNKIAERMLERQEAFSIENVLEILYALPEVREWS